MPQDILERLGTAANYVADFPYVQDAIADAIEEIKDLQNQLESALDAIKERS